MLSLFRWLLRLIIASFLLVGLGLALIWYFSVRSLPDYTARETVNGLGDTVEIVRTTENVPHIFASSDHDAFLALGYAHAQDRLFQMTVLRRAAQGRLAEIYGPRLVAADDLARRLRLTESARESFAQLDDETRNLVRAYAQGINRWIEVVNRDARGRGAPEFFLFADSIPYWQPEDSLAILKLWAFSSTKAAQQEVDRAKLSLTFPERGPQLLYQPGDMPLPVYADTLPGAKFGTPKGEASPSDIWPDRLAGYLATGSTAGGGVWAVDPQHTAAGGALLANDLQAALTAPGIYYLARIELENGGVIGATIPGIPAIISGRNNLISWGISPSTSDDQDIFIEEVQPGDSNRYRTPEGWQDFSREIQTIRVLDEGARKITLRNTENGPVLPGVHFGLNDILPIGHVAALAWPGLSNEDGSISGLIALMRAGNREDAIAAAQTVTAPTAWLTIADQDGIARIETGKAPQRGQANDGRYPSAGWVVENRWNGFHPPATPQAPSDKGLVRSYSGIAAGGSFPQTARLGRLDAMRDIHSRESLMDEQTDIVSEAARRLLPVVGANLWYTGEPAAAGTPERQRQDALALLASWDGTMSEHLPEPLIYSAWMAELQARLIRDETGPLAARFTNIYPNFIEAVFRNTAGGAAWCDVVQSAPIEDCTTIARQSLDAAIIDLSSRFGPNIPSWRWGDAHQAVHTHPALNIRPLFGWVANIRQSVSGGDFTLAQSGMISTGKNRWQAIYGAGYRGIYDLTDPDNSVFIISTGQSGHPLSRHYDDLGELWRRGEYIRMSLDPALARAASIGITTLVPEALRP